MYPLVRAGSDANLQRSLGKMYTLDRSLVHHRGTESKQPYIDIDTEGAT